MADYKILVTGGSGFLGKRIVEELLGNDSVLKVSQLKILDVRTYEGIKDRRIEFIQGDICDPAVIRTACQDVDIVIHSAAMVDWGVMKPRQIHDINYGGTQTLLEVSRESGVQAFVYTSSVDAIYTGKPLIDVSEDHVYPTRYPNMYGQSKSEAEQLTLSSAGGEMKVASIRPADIWGEDDPYHLEALFKQARTGFYVRLGSGKALCQHVYVGNCAHAHVLLAKALVDGNSQADGQVYFITDSPSENFFEFFDKIVLGSGQKVWPKNLWIPKSLAYGIGAISELIAILWRPIAYYNPSFSRFAVEYTCTTYTFTAEKAIQDFGYHNKYALPDALADTISYYATGAGR